jgi:hypothetical protein
MRITVLSLPLMLMAVLYGCGSNEPNTLVLFEAEGESFSSIAIERGAFYINPVIKGSKIAEDYPGRKIQHFRDKGIVCHKFGDAFVIARFESQSAVCFGMQFFRRKIGNQTEYVSQCFDKKYCVDTVFFKRPYLRYFLDKDSRLIKFRFDPEYGDSVDYIAKGNGEYRIM